jgi:hypothetical protein
LTATSSSVYGVSVTSNEPVTVPATATATATHLPTESSSIRITCNSALSAPRKATAASHDQRHLSSRDRQNDGDRPEKQEPVMKASNRLGADARRD